MDRWNQFLKETLERTGKEYIPYGTKPQKRQRKTKKVGRKDGKEPENICDKDNTKQ